MLPSIFEKLNFSGWGCDTDNCWASFQSTSMKLVKDPDLSEKEVQCIGLRTYLQCLDNLHGCTGNIKFHSVKRHVRNKMKEVQCSSNGPTYTTKDEDIEEVLPPDELCTYREAKEYKRCGLFGDPHIQTFNNEFQTCTVKGAWPLVQNKYLTVQVTNELVSYSEGATATTKVSIYRNTNLK